MRFSTPSYSERLTALKTWHVWFAWYPVRIGNRDVRWMERVLRRLTHYDSDYNSHEWEYRAI